MKLQGVVSRAGEVVRARLGCHSEDLIEIVPTTPESVADDLDSLDQWPTILKRNATWEDGVRQEMVVSWNERGVPAAGVDYDGALIQKQFKIVTGHQGGSGFWTGPIHPNASGLVDPVRNGTACGGFSCCDGCLFDVRAAAVFDE